jgi:hypothetical protein
MSNRVSGRIVSALLLAVMMALAVQQYILKLGQTDRAAYLSEQAQNYDQHVAHPLNIIALVVVCAFVVGGAVALYELLALGAYKMLNKISMNEGAGSGGYGLREGGSEKGHE